jgi:hypothetical protein
VVITNRGEVTTTLTKNGEKVEFANEISEEGIYTLNVVDQYFNEVELCFVIDKAAPTIYAENKEVAASSNGMINVEVDVYDTIDGYSKLLPEVITHTSGNTVEIEGKEISVNQDWEGTYTLTYKTTDKSGRETTKEVTITVYLADISIELSVPENSVEYNGQSQLSNITACIVDKDGNEISCDLENDIEIKVTDLEGNQKELKNAGMYTITAIKIKETSEPKVYLLHYH